MGVEGVGGHDVQGREQDEVVGETTKGNGVLRTNELTLKRSCACKEIVL